MSTLISYLTVIIAVVAIYLINSLMMKKYAVRNALPHVVSELIRRFELAKEFAAAHADEPRVQTLDKLKTRLEAAVNEREIIAIYSDANAAVDATSENNAQDSDNTVKESEAGLNAAINAYNAVAAHYNAALNMTLFRPAALIMRCRPVGEFKIKSR